MSIRSLARRPVANFAGTAAIALLLTVVYWSAGGSHPPQPGKGGSAVEMGTPVHLIAATDTLFGNTSLGPVFNFSGLKPGDTASASVTVTYGDPQGLASITLQEQNVAHNGPAGSGDLSSQLDLLVVDSTLSHTLFNGKFNGLTSPIAVCGVGTGCPNWGLGETHSFLFKVSVPQSLDNTYEGTSASSDLVWNASGVGLPNVSLTRKGGSEKVLPGDFMAAGYSFQVPNNPSGTTLTFNSAQATFNVKCQSGAAPATHSFTINLAAGPYAVPASSSLWYPNGNGAAHESYENATVPSPAPALCGPGVMIVTSATLQTRVTASPAVGSIRLRFHYTDGGAIDCSNGAVNPGAGTSACNGGWSPPLDFAP